MKRIVVLLCLLFLFGCGRSRSVDWPKYTLAYSEYPSWSVFGVAKDKGLITGDRTNPGSLERKWHVLVDLKLVDYDTCMSMYGSSTVEAVCVTNMDALNLSLARPTTAIMPTSTSNGADACVAVGVESPQGLKRVYGLKNSVSEYVFARCMEELNLPASQCQFVNMDPGAAAQALQTHQKGIEAIMVWNPFVMQTLRTRPDAIRLFDSSKIPGEVVDMVVVSRAVLDRSPQGREFSACLCEAFYEVNKMLADPKTGDATYVSLGNKFSNLNAADMRQCCKETLFYSTPKKGVAVFESFNFQLNNRKVVKFCLDHNILKVAPLLGYLNGAAGDLNFDATYMELTNK